MKTIKKFILATFLVFAFSALTAQTPPPPNNGNGSPGGGNTPVGGGAPIGSGLIILLSVAAGYGTRKVYTMRKEMEVLP